jgi:hypothetical protein
MSPCAPSLEEAKDFYVGTLDFREVAEWDYADELGLVTAAVNREHLARNIRPQSQAGNHYALRPASNASRTRWAR